MMGHPSGSKLFANYASFIFDALSFDTFDS